MLASKALDIKDWVSSSQNEQRHPPRTLLDVADRNFRLSDNARGIGIQAAHCFPDRRDFQPEEIMIYQPLVY